MTASGNSPREQLLASARQGDPHALGSLLESYRNYLWFLARVEIDRQLQGKVDPSDLVQETFLAAHRDFANFRGQSEAELMGWLRRMMASNLVNLVRRYRQAKRRDVRLEQQLAANIEQSSVLLERGLAASQTSPSQQMIQREQSVALADALRQLPPNYRDAILLRQVEGLSFNEVAARMDRSVDSVKKLWIRGLAKLRDLLGEDHASE
jgi:RNA polymerase sigma-70 factor (ECF subfamily)